MRLCTTIPGIIGVLIGSHAVCAQCTPEWSGFDPPYPSQALTVWDRDGTGPEQPVLVAAKTLPYLGPVGEVQVGRYDGRAWRPIGEPLGGPRNSTYINTLAVATTSGVGSPAPGPYAGGLIREAGGEPANNIAHWDGQRWREVGGGVGGVVHSLYMFDEDGSGPNEGRLFVGGGFVGVAGLPYPGIVRWDGAQFSTLGGGIAAQIPGNGPIVLAMIEFDDDGPGPREPALYAAGSFAYADGLRVNSIARWDGTNWEALGTGLGSGVSALAVFDADGPGPGPPMLYVGGGFVHDPGGRNISNLARWDGQQWRDVPGYAGGGIQSLYVFDDDGDGPNRTALFLSGGFSAVGSVPANAIAKWDGQEWFALGSGFTGFPGSAAETMIAFDEDDNPATPAGLYVGGIFFYAGGIQTTGLARWGCPSPICFADCDESTGLGVLDIFDFLCFQNSFVTSDPYACDCDTTTGPNVCDIIDFLCFQKAFIAGCP